MYKLIIFDLDGTILDTLEDLANSTNYALLKHNFSARSIEEIRSFVGNGIQNLIRRAVPDGTEEAVVQNVFQDFKQHYSVHCADFTQPYEGIVEVLSVLRHQKIMTAVVSNKADFAVRQLCEQYFPDLFDYVVGEREGIKRKPAPDSVYEVLEALQVQNSEVLYIGDSDVDIQTANNAEVDQISVEWGFRTAQFLQEHGATKLVKKPIEILDYLGF